MGSGKTAVGMELATQTHLNYLDLDDEISRREMKTISKIFEDSGEIYFRKRESEVLKELLEQENNFILSLGGGTPCYGKNLQEIKNTQNATTIYLKTSLAELTQRLIKEREQRPLIQHLGSREILEDFIRKHLFERSFYYSQSDVIVNTDEKSIPVIVEEIIAALN